MKQERKNNAPFLIDRADGVQGHFAIARWKDSVYTEYWNPSGWAAFGYVFLNKQLAEEQLSRLPIAAKEKS